jgi:hypothetical protein
VAGRPVFDTVGRGSDIKAVTVFLILSLEQIHHELAVWNNAVFPGFE